MALIEMAEDRSARELFTQLWAGVERTPPGIMKPWGQRQWRAITTSRPQGARGGNRAVVLGESLLEGVLAFGKGTQPCQHMAFYGETEGGWIKYLDLLLLPCPIGLLLMSPIGQTQLETRGQRSPN